jgi:MFS family permease
MAGPFLGIGRWKCIMIANVFVIVGAGLTLTPYWYPFLIGRFLYGVATGGFSCFCPKYISEVAPTEVKGPAGALSQICICFGIVVPSTLRMVFNISTDMPYDLDKSHLLVYILFAIPIVLALLQVILMVTVFRYDTPNMLK